MDTETEVETEKPEAKKPKKPLWKRIVKGLLWFLGGTLLFVLLAFLTLPLWINPVATSLAKSLVPKYTGTAFDVQDVKLNPYTGKLLISGVKLANPAGYDEESAFKLGKLTADVEMTSLLSKTIHVREVVVENPFASYVFDAEGVNNFDRIIAAVNEKLGPKEEKEEEPSEKKVVIDKVTVTGVEVVLGKGRFALASLTLTDFGRDDVPAKLEISDVKLVNPSGFETENAFSLNSLSVSMETGDLGALPLKIHDVVIDSPYASYVFDEANVDNITRMLEPLLAKGGEPEKKAKKEEKKEEQAKESSAAPVTLDRLEVKNLKAQVCKGRFELASLVVTDFGKPTPALIKLEGARLVNPEGFAVPDAFRLKSLSVEMETADLSKKPMVFHDIIVDSTYVGIVLNENLDNNIKAMFGPLMGKDKEDKEQEAVAEEEKGDSEESGPRVVIDKLDISGTKIQLYVPLKIMNINFTLPIPLPTFENIGKDAEGSEKGATVKEVAGQVYDKVEEKMGGVAGPVFTKVVTNLGKSADYMKKLLDPAELMKQCPEFMQKFGHKIGEVAGELKEKGGAVVNDLKEKGGAVANKVGEGISNVKGKIGDGLSSVKEKGGAMLNRFIPGGDKKEEKKDEKEAEEKKEDTAEGKPGVIEGAKGLLNKVNPFGN